MVLYTCMQPVSYLESEMPFCSNAECFLHVRTGDPGVEGQGNWAVVDETLTVGRGRYGNHMLCDRCGRELLNSQSVVADGSAESCPTAEEPQVVLL